MSALQASPNKIPAGLPDLKRTPSGILFYFIFFLEEFQVRDVGVEKIDDLIIPFLFLVDFHASALPPHGCLFSFLLRLGLPCEESKSATECPCPGQDFFFLFLP